MKQETGDVSELTQSIVRELAKLVSFDTTSRNSNLELIDYVDSTLSGFGAECRRVASPDKRKANLYATFGPKRDGGILLSGHTDVVPADGQDWTSDPFMLREQSGRLYGRGTSDMKSFLALMLAAAPRLARPGALNRPVTMVFTYDEEVGCFGAPRVIQEIAQRLPQPAAVVVGEPTSMRVVRANKGISVWKVMITGHAAHSSRTDCGASANMAAVRLMAVLADIAKSLREEADPCRGFEPAEATLTIGEIHGGTAANILAEHCEFKFDLRCLPGMDPDVVIAPFLDALRKLDTELSARFDGAGITIERITDTPPLSGRGSDQAQQLIRGLAGDDGPTRMASFAAEAGQFEQAGFLTVLCGPGGIEQAHTTDEFIEQSQIASAAHFVQNLHEAMSHP